MYSFQPFSTYRSNMDCRVKWSLFVFYQSVIPFPKFRYSVGQCPDSWTRCLLYFSAVDIVMNTFDSDDSSEPSEVIEYKGYSYEKKWTGRPVGNWTLWKCTKRGCAGELVITAIRTKRWRRKRFVMFRDVSGKKLMAYVPRQSHNHAPQSPNVKEIPRQNKTTVVMAKVRLPTPPLSPNPRLTDSSAVQSEH